MNTTLILDLKATNHGAGYFYIDKSLIKTNILNINKKYIITIEEMK